MSVRRAARYCLKKKEERRWRREKSGVSLGPAAVCERPTIL